MRIKAIRFSRLLFRFAGLDHAKMNDSGAKSPTFIIIQFYYNHFLDKISQNSV